MPATPPQQNPSLDSTYSRNATRINLSIALPGGKFARVGRVQSVSQNISNNVQVLAELGSQVMVELKKGISVYTFSIAKMYVISDVFDQLRAGQIFGLELSDNSNPSAAIILEHFKQCALTSVSRTFTQGQATVAQDASVVTIGSSTGNPN